MVSTHVKNISQIGSFPQVGVKINNIWNHHPDNIALGNGPGLSRCMSSWKWGFSSHVCIQLIGVNISSASLKVGNHKEPRGKMFGILSGILSSFLDTTPHVRMSSIHLRKAYSPSWRSATCPRCNVDRALLRFFPWAQASPARSLPARLEHKAYALTRIGRLAPVIESQAKSISVRVLSEFDLLTCCSLRFFKTHSSTWEMFTSPTSGPLNQCGHWDDSKWENLQSTMTECTNSCWSRLLLVEQPRDKDVALCLWTQVCRWIHNRKFPFNTRGALLRPLTWFFFDVKIWTSFILHSMSRSHPVDTIWLSCWLAKTPMDPYLDFLGPSPNKKRWFKTIYEDSWYIIISHSIHVWHVWYIYLHLPYIYAKWK